MKSNLVDNYYDHDDDFIEHKSFKQTNPLIIQTTDKLRKCGPFDFFGTLSFQYKIDQEYAWCMASLHWRRLQKLVLGKRWIRKGTAPLHGVIILETHPVLSTRTTQIITECHFHYLIKGHTMLSGDPSLASNVLDSGFAKAARSLTHKNRRWQLVSRHGTKVIPIYNLDDVCGYVSKEAWSWRWNWNERIGYLGQEGVI